MPFVLVRYKPSLVSDQVLEVLTQALPAIVASALHLADESQAHLSPEDVIVEAQVVGRFSVNANGLDIFIDANESDGRLRTIDDRRHTIVKGICRVLAGSPCGVCGVWVRLIHGSYETL